MEIIDTHFFLKKKDLELDAVKLGYTYVTEATCLACLPSK